MDEKGDMQRDNTFERTADDAASKRDGAEIEGPSKTSAVAATAASAAIISESSLMKVLFDVDKACDIFDRTVRFLYPKSAEKLKAQAEKRRAQADKDIVQADKDIARSEDLRDQAQKHPTDAEWLRVRVDTARAEALRREAEALRSEAEALRIKSEMDRGLAELLRGFADTDEARAEELQAEAKKDLAHIDDRRFVSSQDVLTILGLTDDDRAKLLRNAAAWRDILFEEDYAKSPDDSTFYNTLVKCLKEILEQFIERLRSASDSVFRLSDEGIELCKALVKGVAVDLTEKEDLVKEVRTMLHTFTGGYIAIDKSKYARRPYKTNPSYTPLPFERMFLSLVLVHPKKVKGFSVGQEPKQSIGVSGIAVRIDDEGAVSLDEGCPTVKNLNTILRGKRRDGSLNVKNLYKQGVVCWNLYFAEVASCDQRGYKVHQPESSEALFVIIWEAWSRKLMSSEDKALPIAFWGGVNSLKGKIHESLRTKKHICWHYDDMNPELSYKEREEAKRSGKCGLSTLYHMSASFMWFLFPDTQNVDTCVVPSRSLTLKHQRLSGPFDNGLFHLFDSIYMYSVRKKISCPLLLSRRGYENEINP